MLYSIEPGNGWSQSEHPEAREADVLAPDKVLFSIPPTADKSSFMSHTARDQEAA